MMILRVSSNLYQRNNTSGNFIADCIDELKHQINLQKIIDKNADGDNAGQNWFKFASKELERRIIEKEKPEKLTVLLESNSTLHIDKDDEVIKSEINSNINDNLSAFNISKLTPLPEASSKFAVRTIFFETEPNLDGFKPLSRIESGGKFYWLNVKINEQGHYQVWKEGKYEYKEIPRSALNIFSENTFFDHSVIKDILSFNYFKDENIEFKEEKFESSSIQNSSDTLKNLNLLIQSLFKTITSSEGGDMVYKTKKEMSGFESKLTFIKLLLDCQGNYIYFTGKKQKFWQAGKTKTKVVITNSSSSSNNELEKIFKLCNPTNIINTQAKLKEDVINNLIVFLLKKLKDKSGQSNILNWKGTNCTFYIFETVFYKRIELIFNKMIGTHSEENKLLNILHHRFLSNCIKSEYYIEFFTFIMYVYFYACTLEEVSSDTSKIFTLDLMKIKQRNTNLSSIIIDWIKSFSESKLNECLTLINYDWFKTEEDESFNLELSKNELFYFLDSNTIFDFNLLYLNENGEFKNKLSNFTSYLLKKEVNLNKNTLKYLQLGSNLREKIMKELLGNPSQKNEDKIVKFPLQLDKGRFVKIFGRAINVNEKKMNQGKTNVKNPFKKKVGIYAYTPSLREFYYILNGNTTNTFQGTHSDEYYLFIEESKSESGTYKIVDVVSILPNQQGYKDVNIISASQDPLSSTFKKIPFTELVPIKEDSIVDWNSSNYSCSDLNKVEIINSIFDDEYEMTSIKIDDGYTKTLDSCTVTKKGSILPSSSETVVKDVSVQGEGDANEYVTYEEQNRLWRIVNYFREHPHVFIIHGVDLKKGIDIYYLYGHYHGKYISFLLQPSENKNKIIKKKVNFGGEGSKEIDLNESDTIQNLMNLSFTLPENKEKIRLFEEFTRILLRVSYPSIAINLQTYLNRVILDFYSGYSVSFSKNTTCL